MKHFTMDAENNITAYASKKAAREAGAEVFSTEEQLIELIGPDNKRLVGIWNSLPGVTPVSKFANRKVAAERIWKAIQNLGAAAAKASPVPASEETIADQPELTPDVATEGGSELLTDEAAAADIERALPEEFR